MQSHYTVVSLKGQHISLVPNVFASKVITETQHSCLFHTFAKGDKN